MKTLAGPLSSVTLLPSTCTASTCVPLHGCMHVLRPCHAVSGVLVCHGELSNRMMQHLFSKTLLRSASAGHASLPRLQKGVILKAALCRTTLLMICVACPAFRTWQQAYTLHKPCNNFHKTHIYYTPRLDNLTNTYAATRQASA